MSRAGYSEDCDGWELAMYRGQVASAIRGKRGQKFFRDLASALDAMPVKELIAEELEKDGAVCALGALGKARGIDMSAIDPEDAETVSEKFDIAEQLVREVVWENDDDSYWNYELRRNETITPALRWERMRKWVATNLPPVVTFPTPALGDK